MRKATTKKIILLIIVIISLYTIKDVYAYRAHMPYINMNEGGSGGSTSEYKKPEEEYDDGDEVYVCKYNTNLGYIRNINVNAYDMEGRTIIPYTYISTVQFKAGTWVGINLQEYKSITWNVTDLEYGRKVKKYKCEYSSPYTYTYQDDASYNECINTCKNIYCGTNDPNEIEQRCSNYSQKSKTTTDYKEENITVAYNKAIECPDYSEMGYSLYRGPYDIIDDTIPINREITECKEKAIKKTVNSAISYINSPSLEVEIVNANNYKNENDDIEIIQFDNSTQKETNVPEKIQYEAKGEFYATYEYSPSKVCIDVKTSEVNYDTEYKTVESTKCTNKENVKEIKNSETYDELLGETVEYWHYFIPLDTNTNVSDTSDVGFYLKVFDSWGGMGSNMCKQILEKYPRILPKTAEEIAAPNYLDYITPIPLTSQAGKEYKGFIGDYFGKNGSTSKDYKLFDQGYGCKFASKTKFNIEQKFYGETEKNGNKIIKGYGFYYRPININNPFPNIIASDSIWNGLYSNENNENKIVVKDENEKTITTKLSESFNTITYIASNISPKEIRNYNNLNKYTSWQNMNLDGTSNFIKNYNYITKNYTITNNIYKLGCGPANVSWEECK